jgi:hypothetical protein
MSISNVGTPAQQQVPEILWARGPEPTDQRPPVEKADPIDPTGQAPVAAVQQPEPPREPDQVQATAPDSQGRLLDRRV